jgi:hypothetical protein
LSIHLGTVGGICFGQDGGELADLLDDGCDLVAGQSWSGLKLRCGGE